MCERLDPEPECLEPATEKKMNKKNYSLMLFVKRGAGIGGDAESEKEAARKAH